MGKHSHLDMLHLQIVMQERYIQALRAEIRSHEQAISRNEREIEKAQAMINSSKELLERKD